MKSAYDIAMERLNKATPIAKLNPEQKRELAVLDSQYTAKIAEREIALNDAMAKADDLETTEALRNQLVQARQKLQAELEAKKEESIK